MARNLRGPACPGYGKARDAASAAGEGRLVAAALGVLVEQIGVAVVGVVAVVVGALGDFVEVVAVVVLVADGRLVGIAAVAVGAGRQQPEGGNGGEQGDFRHRYSPTPWRRPGPLRPGTLRQRRGAGPVPPGARPSAAREHLRV